MSNTITFHMFKTKTTGVGEKEERQGESRGRGQEGESERRDLDLLVFGWDEREFRRKYVWNSMLWKWSHCYQHISPRSLEIWNVSRHCPFRAQCCFFFFLSSGIFCHPMANWSYWMSFTSHIIIQYTWRLEKEKNPPF